ncbi:hypothetical protein ml_276 [Mollivirus sibericum]|uniref:hypothetical protein n=1 Tax=Mollivirus sibericum TaxID=1678078 RepID=UPI0006B2EF47|nr:hypothetical protein ml_276 [Mollivirus sibericum]ALD62078.1 hypothetical protein ml_276 [Mollivirus sibericum]
MGRVYRRHSAEEEEEVAAPISRAFRRSATASRASRPTPPMSKRSFDHLSSAESVESAGAEQTSAKRSRCVVEKKKKDEQDWCKPMVDAALSDMANLILIPEKASFILAVLELYLERLGTKERRLTEVAYEWIRQRTMDDDGGGGGGLMDPGQRDLFIPVVRFAFVLMVVRAVCKIARPDDFAYEDDAKDDLASIDPFCLSSHDNEVRFMRSQFNYVRNVLVKFVKTHEAKWEDPTVDRQSIFFCRSDGLTLSLLRVGPPTGERHGDALHWRSPPQIPSSDSASDHDIRSIFEMACMGTNENVSYVSVTDTPSVSASDGGVEGGQKDPFFKGECPAEEHEALLDCIAHDVVNDKKSFVVATFAWRPMTDDESSASSCRALIDKGIKCHHLAEAVRRMCNLVDVDARSLLAAETKTHVLESHVEALFSDEVLNAETAITYRTITPDDDDDERQGDDESGEEDDDDESEEDQGAEEETVPCTTQRGFTKDRVAMFWAREHFRLFAEMSRVLSNDPRIMEGVLNPYVYSLDPAL